MPDIKEMEKKPRGTYKVVLDTNNDVALVCWKDNKAVTVASTYCGAAPVGKAKRFSRADRRRIEIPQPQVVKVYNMGMGGVDIPVALTFLDFDETLCTPTTSDIMLNMKFRECFLLPALLTISASNNAFATTTLIIGL